MHEVLIIGCGLIAGGFDADRAPDALPFTHAGAFARCPAFTVTACVDPDAERRSAFQARWNVSEGGADLAALAQPGRFAVISICSPTELHRAHMEQALTLRPKVIFCEKPVAKTSAETRALAELCSAQGVLLAVNYTRRWDPAVVRLARELRSGDWGRVRSASGIYTKGVVHNGGHMIDLLRLLLGEVDLIASGAPVYDFWNDDPSVPAMLASREGVPILLSLGDARDYAVFELTLVTERGTVTMLDGGRAWSVREAAASGVFAGYRALEPAVRREGEYDASMLAAVANLAEAIDDGRTLASHAGNALAAQILCETIRDAAIDGAGNPQRTKQ
ncbi:MULTISPECIES: Gfo/Idh/MocA family protein [Sphingomonas]|uniref:Gfo/Idh/MocA family protein n=2 Tax=Sphingomonadaceae TaxID=41297 RepID=UPI0009677755|nr:MULTISPECIES: Gfo/Idh/MocA family oxidoreductase [unclassified Sphingomonas]MBN8811834.1 Gfo/Idh/MocA family oxidoreductase [Sphingomonas sp.]OJY52794.1 MAG: hypothetical protein BGP17_14710 [Sphingomonas sp. 67-41]